MKLPFTVEQFLGIFRDYNNSIFPLQFLFYLMALTAIIFAFRKTKRSDSIISIILSFFWLWMGIVYHIMHFTDINKAAFIFGGVFIVQGFLILYAGVLRKKLSFHYRSDIYGITGLLFIFYSLIVYPILSNIFGHIYPYSPTFGLPCPTTIFTFGLFLWTDSKFPKALLIIPFLWSIVGFSAATSLGITEDTGLIVAGLMTTGMMIYRERKFKKLSAN